MIDENLIYVWELNMEIKRLAATVANHSGILDSYAFLRRKLTRSQVAILLYHRIYHKKDELVQRGVNAENFERQMKYVCRNFSILSLDRLVECIQSKKQLPEKAVVVTFDDGYRDNYFYAYPILRKYQIPATIFLVTGCIENSKLFWWDEVGYIIQHTSIRQVDLGEFGIYSLQSKPQRLRAESMIKRKLKKLPEKDKNLLIERLHNLCHTEIPNHLARTLVLSWDDVEEMYDGGITFGAHTVNHPILTNLPSEQAESEIMRSKNDIQKRLGVKVTSLSYPNGNFSPEIVDIVKKSGFTSAVTMVPKLAGSRDCIFKLCRIDAHEDFNEFKACLSGLYGDLVG